MRRAAAVLLGASALALLPAGTASAHPLGNFTVNTADRLVVTADGVALTHVVDLAEIPTVQLGQARAGVDTDADGTLSAAELTAWGTRECTRAAGLLDVQVDGTATPLQLSSAVAASRPGAAGLATTRLTCEYDTGQRPRSTVAFSDAAAGERNGWREVTAGSLCGPLRSSSVPAESPSGLLTSYPEDLLQSPVDVTTARFEVRAGAACSAAGATSGTGATEEQVAPRGVDRLSRVFTDFLGRRDLTLPFALVSLGAAVLFGVLHAMAPGHGKTVMAAYLVGQRGTRRQALQLGAIVTFTHTVSVLLLGAVLALGALAAPELVVPFTEVLSGVLLAAVGGYLLLLAVRRLRSGPEHDHDHGDHQHDHHPHDHGDHQHDEHGHGHGPHEHDHPHAGGDGHPHPHGAPSHDHSHDHGHPHDHDHDHEHPHDDHPHEDDDLVRTGAPQAPAAGGGTAVAVRPLVHSHGGRAHTHAPLPDGPLSWKTLAGMGVAGGLVPSPSALLVLLSATALGRAWFGVVLVVAYGLGMAVTLTVAGLLLLRARAALDRRGWSLGRGHSLARLLPLGTAAVVVLVGVGLVVRGLVTGQGLL